jgi:microcystin-dependent protein
MQPYVGEIRLFAGNFAPSGWMFCDGSTLPISENEVLFQLIGTTYGGDGEETFQLPNLQGRVPLHFGTSPSGVTYQIGEMAGEESVTLSTQQIPTHTHAALAASVGQTTSPSNAVLATAQSTQQGVRLYSTVGSTTTLGPGTITPTGGSQPHENMQPFLGLNFIISLFGFFPSQT